MLACLVKLEANRSGRIMSDYYIRTPDKDESRGPFDVSKLNTLAEAEQINPNTLYYDEDKEEWLPIALNEELHAQVFPKREKLSLKINTGEPGPAKAKAEKKTGDIKVEAMLAAAEGDTAEKRKHTKRKKSLHRTASSAAVVLAIMMLFSSLFMVLPLVPELGRILDANGPAFILNYPTLLLGIFDLIMSILLLLSVTEVYPLLRGRAMLGLGFGGYVGWAIGDPWLMGLTVAAGLGIFLGTLAQQVRTLVLAGLLGIGGHAYLAYLALNGRFDGFFESVVFNLVG
jgi:hypothetical protein